MCCEGSETFDLPPDVIEAIGAYRLAAERIGFDWGEEGADLFRLGRLFQPVVSALTTSTDPEAAFRSVLDALPPGMLLATVRRDGELELAHPDPPFPRLPGGEVEVDVVFTSAADGPERVTVGDEGFDVVPGAPTVRTLRLGAAPVAAVVAGRSTDLAPLTREVPPAALRLHGPHPARWSVVDEAGGGWFPDGVRGQWSSDGRPYFHARDATLTVPATTLTVTCARGLEHAPVVRTLALDPGAEAVVEADPPRVIDPAADGWYGGDLHVHLNYSGDLVRTPQEAGCAQLAEGLHVMNLTAANMLTSTVYDRALLEAYAGEPLPWSGPDALAAAGVEYRNDLLGHVHAFAPTAPPREYHSGHQDSDRPYDWPPNAHALQELRDLDATVGYCHPVLTEWDDDRFDRFFLMPRSTECRELVVDAALGLVDSIDVLAPTSNEGAARLYHQLLSCGFPLAPTAGTDTFLSFSRTTPHSNPPGWGRVYARVDGPLTLDSFKAAVRAGRTLVTNGPWVEFAVDGAIAGSVLDVRPGATVSVGVACGGTGGETITVVGPDGPLADGPADRPLTVELVVDRPLWLAAVVRGGPHEHVLDLDAFAHTGAVFVDVDGARVARAGAAAWCIRLVDAVEQHLREHGHFHDDDRGARLDEYAALFEQARQVYRDVQHRAN
jgi:hypothetical protein